MLTDAGERGVDFVLGQIFGAKEGDALLDGRVGYRRILQDWLVVRFDGLWCSNWSYLQLIAPSMSSSRTILKAKGECLQAKREMEDDHAHER